MTKKNSNKESEALKARIVELEARLSRAKETKEKSEVFVDSKGELIKWSNLSETKKYFEKEHLEFLKSNGETFTSSEFHQLLGSMEVF
tara:strand:- start:1713 stop:1976 length:264 start_codon:yes stop_codon:yes gene_type:complete